VPTIPRMTEAYTHAAVAERRQKTREAIAGSV
jgi:hypothetical protein